MPVRQTTTTTKVTTSTTTPASGSIMYSHHRYNCWVALTVLSLVSLLSILDESKYKKRDFEEKWALAMAGISLCLGFLASLGHGLVNVSGRFVSSLLEFVMALIVVICWALALPIITTPNNGLSVDQNFQVDNANLYFSTWGSFLIGVYLLASVSNDRGFHHQRGGSLFVRWVMLLVASTIVMVASARMYERVCEKGNNNPHGEFCTEIRLGVALGTISAFLAGMMMLLVWFTPSMIPVDVLGFIICIFMLVIWGVLVAFLTFDNGPASRVGNLFFGVWVSAIIALDLAVCYVMAFMM